MAHHPEPLPPPPRRRHRRRRWGRKLLIGTAILIVLLLAAVQVVLWSPLPKSIAEARVRKVLGAAATIESVSVGWLGTTRAHNVTLTLPLGSAPLVQVRELVIRHDALPLMPFTRDVDSITAHGVVLDLRQDREGKWNLQHLIENRPDDPTPAPPGAVLDLPDLYATGVTVHAATFDGRFTTLSDLNVQGVRRAPLDYELSFDAGPDLTARGRMALTRDASHELKVHLDRVPDAVRPLLGELPEPLRAEVTWSGRRTPSGIDGTLQVAHAAAGRLRASGRVELFTWENRLVAAPRGLTVQLLEPPTTQPATATATTTVTTTTATAPATAPATRPMHQIVLEGGRVLFGREFALQRLRMKYKNGRFALDGAVDRRNQTAELTAAWDEIAEAGLGLAGRAKVRLQRQLTGQLHGTADIEGSVTAGAGVAHGKVFITAGGDSLQTLYADIRSDAITWSSPAGRQFAVPGLEVAIRSDGRTVRLHSLALRDQSLGQIAAQGSYHIADKFWYAAVSTRDLRLADLRVPGVRKPIDFDLDVYGDTRRLDVKHFYLRHGGAMYWTQGFYDKHLPKPVNFNAYAWYTPAKLEFDHAGFQGLRFQGEVTGMLHPRDLHARGSLQANELQARGRYIGDISAYVEAHFQPGRMTLESPNDIELLGGKWKLRGEWRQWQHSRRNPLIVRVDWRDLPVGALCDAAKIQGFTGMIDRGSADITIAGPTIRDVTAYVETTGKTLAAGPTTADTLKLTATLDSGDVIADLALTSGRGTINAKIGTNIAQPTPITIASTLTDWPAATAKQREQIRDVQAYLSGKFDVKVVPETRTINADAQLTGRIERGGGQVGDFELTGYSQNRRLTLKELTLRTLDGTAQAAGDLNLDDVNAANLDVEYRRLDLQQLAWLLPALKDFGGRYSGELHIHPATERRPLGPITIHFNVKPDGGHYRTINIGEIDLTGYAAYEGPRDFRVVIGGAPRESADPNAANRDTAVLNIAGGTVLPFVRLSSTTSHGLTQLVNLDLKGLSLEPIVHAFAAERQPMPGQIDGRIRLYGPATDISTLNGEATIALTNSDLVNYRPVAFLYNLMRVGREGTKPTGSGRIAVRVEQSKATITGARYFNRGVEINAFGPIHHLEKFPQSNPQLVLVGSAQPLRNLKLPFFSDADKILGILQATVTTVEVTGTLRDPQPKQVFISELNDTLRGLLLGVVKDEQQQQ